MGIISEFFHIIQEKCVKEPNTLIVMLFTFGIMFLSYFIKGSLIDSRKLENIINENNQNRQHYLDKKRKIERINSIVNDEDADFFDSDKSISSLHSNDTDAFDLTNETESLKWGFQNSNTSMDTLVLNRYKVERKIGTGTFGDVYSAVNFFTGQEVAIKMESAKHKNPHLLLESKIYRYMEGDIGNPRVHCYGIDGQYILMVMDLLGPSLENLFCYFGRRFRLKTTLMLGDQMIQRIQAVHSNKFLHRDIKPHNFLMGRGNSEKRVHIIDFGLAKQYRNPVTNKHITYKEGRSLTGTARYVSIKTHLGIEQSRRDDLESLGYVLIYFLRGCLPWQGIKASTRYRKYEKIKEKKIETPVRTLCKYLPDEFTIYINYCRSLQFCERPDYDYLRHLFKNLLIREGYTYDFIYDWTYPNAKQFSGSNNKSLSLTNNGCVSDQIAGLKSNSEKSRRKSKNNDSSNANKN